MRLHANWSPVLRAGDPLLHGRKHSLLLVNKSDLLVSISLFSSANAISSLPPNWRRFPAIPPHSGGPLAKREGRPPASLQKQQLSSKVSRKMYFSTPLACLMSSGVFFQFR